VSLAECAPAPLEILVIDQSDDATSAAVVAGMRSAAPQIVHFPDGGRGQARARNLGLARARAPLIAYTDDDCTAAPDWAGALADALDGPVAGALGRTLLGDLGWRPGLAHGGSTHHGAAPARFALDLGERETSGGRGRPHVNPLMIGSGNNMAFRRALFEQIGGFDERLGPGARAHAADDSELLYRALRAGHTLAYAPDALIYHHSWLDARAFQRHRYGYFVGAGLFLTDYALRGDRMALWLLLRRLRWECAALAWDGARRRHPPTLRRALAQTGGTIVGAGMALSDRLRGRGAGKPAGRV
jgi:GT2 family glycosyltransferase